MVRIDLKHRFIMLFAGVHQYGSVGKSVGIANTINGIFMGNPNCSTAIENILGVADCIHTGCGAD